MEMSDLVIMLMVSHSVQAALENSDILVFLNMVANKNISVTNKCQDDEFGMLHKASIATL